jgi:hypothetical protein
LACPDRESGCRARENRFSAPFYAANNKLLSIPGRAGADNERRRERPGCESHPKDGVASYIALC